MLTEVVSLGHHPCKVRQAVRGLKWIMDIWPDDLPLQVPRHEVEPGTSVFDNLRVVFGLFHVGTFQGYAPLLW